MESVKSTVIEQCEQCGLCVTQCSFLQAYGDPRMIGLSFDPSANGASTPLPFLCHLCGLCEAVCPKNLKLKEFFLELRKECAKHDSGYLSGYRRSLAYEKRGLSRRYTLRLLPENCDTVFFPGCTLSATRPDHVLTVYERLSCEIPSLGIVMDCCGKISHDLARTGVFHQNMGELVSFLTQNGITQVITTCPSCSEMFRLHGEPLAARSLFQVMDELNLKGAEAPETVVQVHDCCVDRFQAKVQQSIRRMLKKQGLKLEEMAHSGRVTVCCGEGGLASYPAKAFSDAWSEKRLAEVLHKVVASCAGCVSRLNTMMDIVHVLDVWLDPQNALNGRVKSPCWPRTSWNRLRLKRRLKHRLKNAHISERVNARS